MDKEQVKEFLSSEEGLGLISELGMTKLDKDSVSKFLEDNDEGKSLKFSMLDSEHERRMKKLQEEKGYKILSKTDQEEYRKSLINEINPQLSPVELELKELKVSLAEKENEEKRKTNLLSLMELNKEIGLPTEIISLTNDLDFEKAKGNFSKISETFNSIVDNRVEEIIKQRLGSGYKPQGGQTSTAIDKLDKEIKEAIANGDILGANALLKERKNYGG